MLNATNSDQKRKDLWDSLGPEYQCIIEKHIQAQLKIVTKCLKILLMY